MLLLVLCITTIYLSWKRSHQTNVQCWDNQTLTTGWWVCCLSETYGSDCFCSIILMRLRCVYFRKLASVSSDVISACLCHNRTDMLLWTAIWMFSTRRDCQRVCSRNVTVYWVGQGNWLLVKMHPTKIHTPAPLIWSSLFIQTESLHLVMIDRGFLSHLPVIQICKYHVDNNILYLYCPWKSALVRRWPSTGLHPFRIISELLPQAISLTDFEGLTVMLVAILMEMLSRFIAGPSADSRRTSSCHMNPFISFLGGFPW